MPIPFLLPIDMDCFVITPLPTKLSSPMFTSPLITAEVAIWQLSPILASCSISDLVLIIQFLNLDILVLDSEGHRRAGCLLGKRGREEFWMSP